MKLDIISVVTLVFCLGVCVTLIVEVKGLIKHTNAETVIADTK